MVKLILMLSVFALATTAGIETASKIQASTGLPADSIADWIEKGGTRVILAAIAWMAMRGTIVWGATAKEREQAERENGEKWEKRFMEAFHYSRDAQQTVQKAQELTEKVMERI